MDKKVKALPELTPEEFYNNKDSIYLRLTYDKDQGGYKVLIYNAMEVDRIQENEIKMAILVRGLAELALEYPSEVFQTGYAVSMRDQVDLNTDLSESEKDLLRNPIGTA